MLAADGPHANDDAMPAGSLLTLLDDIATILDDVAVLTKVAAKKTAGVLSDDLALNAEQVSGVRAERELPVVWAVAKGSLVNKTILVPAALAVSAFVPWAVTPLLMLGGTFLCFEGVEKVADKLLHRADETPDLKAALTDPDADFVEIEKDKIKGAIRTDFVLSAEILTIALGTVTAEPIMTRSLVLIAIALVMTTGVYGLVAAIVKLDDLGLHLARTGGSEAGQRIGRGILKTAPVLMKGLGIAGTAAMFLVGGGILTHGVHALAAFGERLAASAHSVPGVGAILGGVVPLAVNMVVGIVAGAVVLAVVSAIKAAIARARAA